MFARVDRFSVRMLCFNSGCPSAGFNTRHLMKRKEWQGGVQFRALNEEGRGAGVWAGAGWCFNTGLNSCRFVVVSDA